MWEKWRGPGTNHNLGPLQIPPIPPVPVPCRGCCFLIAVRNHWRFKCSCWPPRCRRPRSFLSGGGTSRHLCQQPRLSLRVSCTRLDRYAFDRMSKQRWPFSETLCVMTRKCLQPSRRISPRSEHSWHCRRIGHRPRGMGAAGTRGCSVRSEALPAAIRVLDERFGWMVGDKQQPSPAQSFCPVAFGRERFSAMRDWLPRVAIRSLS